MRAHVVFFDLTTDSNRDGTWAGSQRDGTGIEISKKQRDGTRPGSKFGKINGKRPGPKVSERRAARVPLRSRLFLY